MLVVFVRPDTENEFKSFYKRAIPYVLYFYGELDQKQYISEKFDDAYTLFFKVVSGKVRVTNDHGNASFAFVYNRDEEMDECVALTVFQDLFNEETEKYDFAQRLRDGVTRFEKIL